MSHLKKRIHPNTLKFYELDDAEKVQQCLPLDLLNSSRLDVMARYIYAKSKVTGQGIDWGKHCYYDLIRAWSQDFRLPPPYEPGRSSMQDYWDQFNVLIESMARKGYDSSESIIPICNNTLVDGAHRLAASLAHNIPQISTIELDGDRQIQDYKVLQKIGLDNDVLLNMMYEFVKLKSKTRLAVLFPVAQSVNAEFIQAFQNSHHVDYSENIPFTFNGLQNIQRFFYGSHKWWNDWHAYNFARQRKHKFYKNITILFFQEKSEDTTRNIKNKIRKIHSADTHVMHSTDTHEETILAAEILLNKNGRDLMDNQAKHNTKLFKQNFPSLKNLVEKQNLNENIALDTGSVMALYKLRDITDIDYIAASNDFSLQTSNSLISKHEKEYDQVNLNASDIIYDPRKHLIYRGIKFVSLPLVYKLKKQRATLKDLNDALSIEKLQKKNRLNIITLVIFCHKLKYKSLMLFYSMHNYMRRILKRFLSEGDFERLRAIYKKIKRTNRKVLTHIHHLLTNPNYIHLLRWRMTKGDQTYRLNYKLDKNSIVLDVGGYEGQWSQKIYERYQPNIHVFEPVKKYAKLCEGIFKNTPRVHVHEFGLGGKDETIKISLSDDASSIYKSSDNTEEIRIKNVVNYIEDNSFNDIDLIKLNIEGGEYDILEALIQSKHIQKFKHLQIQFHDFVPDAVSRRKKIIQNLRHTHKRDWNYPFVWEGWSRKDG